MKGRSTRHWILGTGHLTFMFNGEDALNWFADVAPHSTSCPTPKGQQTNVAATWRWEGLGTHVWVWSLFGFRPGLLSLSAQALESLAGFAPLRHV